MKKILMYVLLLILATASAGCSPKTAREETATEETAADYPAAIMVDDSIYLLSGEPMPSEVDESDIMGYTKSYTDTYPEKNGETNFNRELNMPYVKVEDGIAVLYENKWYLCVPDE